MHTTLKILILFLILTCNASANLNDCELIQINSTHWYFESNQTDLAHGEYNYQAFANNISSDYRILNVGMWYSTYSLHYNVTSPYNHTIESDGTITANRSIIANDDTNDTAQSTGTSYITINVYDNGASIVRNFTVEGDILDWYQAANLSGEYTLNNGSGILDTQSDVGGLVNFTIDLSAGDYTISQKYKDEEIQFYFI